MGGIAVAAGQDGNAALLAGTNAVENNHMAHYSPDPEAAKREMEEEKQVAQDIAEVAGTQVPGLNEANEVVNDSVDALFDFYDNIPLIEYAPFPVQAMRYMRAPTHVDVDFVLPTTVGGVGLTVAGVAGKVPAAVKGVAGVAIKGGRKLITEIVSAVAKAPAVRGAPVQATKDPVSKMISALDLAALKKAVAPKPSVESPIKPAVKPVPVVEATPKPILKPTPAQKPRASYEESSSWPASSTPRSPQAPSTAPPSSRSSAVTRGTPEVKATPAASEGSIVRQSTQGAEQSAKSGRSGKQKKLRELAKDDKVGSADRGWIKQELNHIKSGERSTLRVPPGKELAHKRGFEAAKGFDYSQSTLQEKSLHKLQHKFDGMGKKNITPKKEN